MSDDKDGLKSIKVYKFDNTKESWHEFALKFRVIADSRGYEDIIDGTKNPLTRRKTLKYFQKMMQRCRRQKGKVGSQNGQQKGYRDLVMTTEGISLNRVENATSDKLSKGDLRKAWGKLERRWNPKTREDKVEVYTKFLNYRLESTRQKPMDWLAFLEKKQTESANTGHKMDDEIFIAHLLNSLPQSEYKGAILVIKDKLRKGKVELPEIEQILEDKYQAMKHVKGWDKEEMIMPSLQANPTRKSTRKYL